MPGQQVVEAMVLLGHKQSDPLPPAGKSQTHLHLMPPGQRLQPVQDLFFLQSEVFQAPLQPHEEGIHVRVDVLLEVDDVPAMRKDETRDIVNQPGAVRAVNEERGSVRHGR